MIRHFNIYRNNAIVPVLLLSIWGYAAADKPVRPQTQTATDDLVAKLTSDALLSSRPVMALHLDCADATLTVKLAGPGRTVQGLTLQTESVPALRLKLRQQGLAGRVSLDPLTESRLHILTT